MKPFISGSDSDRRYWLMSTKGKPGEPAVMRCDPRDNAWTHGYLPVRVLDVYALKKNRGSPIWCRVIVDDKEHVQHVQASEIAGSAVVDMWIAAVWRRAGGRQRDVVIIQGPDFYRCEFHGIVKINPYGR